MGPIAPEDPQSDNQYYNPPDGEPSEANATHFWRMHAWLLNWYLPALPIALESSQHFLNTKNWLWPGDLSGEMYQRLWEDFTVGFMNVHNQTSVGGIRADPENPKDGASVSDE